MDGEQMAYCTKTDILKKITDGELAMLTSETGVTDDTVVAECIAEADGEIDSYAGRQYVVPMSPVPDRVRNLSIDISIFKAAARRAFKLGAINDSIRGLYDDAIAFLKDVAAGRAVIDGAVKPSQNTERTGGFSSANDRTFTPDSLKGF